MAECIEKYDAYKMIYDFQHEKLKNGQVLISLRELREITFRIPALPTIDIVHCRECKHWKDSDGVYRRGIDAESKCRVNCEEVMRGDWFCADGERRTE